MASISYLSCMVFILTCCITLKAFTVMERRKMFGDLLYQQVASQEKGNIIISTFNIRALIALLYSGSTEKKNTRLRSKLKAVNQNTTLTDYKFIFDQLTAINSINTQVLANKIYAADTLKLASKFKIDAHVFFDTDVETINFGDAKKVAAQMNKWVSEKTVNHIKSIISPEALTPAMRIILLNALYFHGKWLTPFYQIPKMQKFYASKTDVIEVAMLTTTALFEYDINTQRGYKIIRLPFLGETFSLTILLPNDTVGLEALESNLAYSSVAANLTGSRVRVEVTIPRFQVKKEISLKRALKEVGFRDIFSKLDIPNTVSSDSNLSVGDIRQNLILKVDAPDSLDAKASHEERPASSNASSNYFTADHPFLFFLEASNGAKREVLLQGRVAKPEF